MFGPVGARGRGRGGRGAAERKPRAWQIEQTRGSDDDDDDDEDRGGGDARAVPTTRSRSRSRSRSPSPSPSPPPPARQPSPPRRKRSDVFKNLNPRARLRVEIDGVDVGALVLELFASDAPRTCENFLRLCEGRDRSTRADSNAALDYVGSVFHRIIPGFMAQGGDFERGDGTGGESVFGPTFADESFSRRHDARGALAMANSGRHTNASQFYVTFAPAPRLDGKHVVFGRVTSGFHVLDALERVGSKARSIHWSPYDHVRVVNADP